MHPDSVTNIKIQHHIDLRGQCGMREQMFIITLKFYLGEKRYCI